MSYLTQMTGLTVQNFVSAATGIAIAIALIRGFARRSTPARSATSGSISTRATLYVLLPICIVVHARSSSRAACRRTSTPTRAITTLGGATQTAAAGTGRLARKRSRCSAPTAAASSTPTPPTRSRTRRRSPTSSRCCSIFAIPAGLTYTFGKMVGNTQAGLGDLRRDERALPRSASPSRPSPSRTATRC